MTKNKKKKCKYTKENGERCNAWAMKNSDYCFMHNPDISEERKEAIKKGGLASKKNSMDLPPIEINSVEDVTQLLEDTINQLRSGEIETKMANCIGYLSNRLIKAIEVSKLEKQIGEMNETLDQIEKREDNY